MKTFILSSLLFVASLIYAQELHEPDFVFQANYVNPNGTSMELESQVPKAKHAEYSYTFKFQVKGATSPTRIINDDQPSFIVKMNDNSKDIEGVIHIYRMETVGSSRKGAYKSRNPADDKSYIPFSFSKYGEQSYKLKVSESLEPGEYMIVIWADGARKVSLFGVD